MTHRLRFACIVVLALIGAATKAQAALILPLDNSWTAVTQIMIPGQFISAINHSQTGVDALSDAIRWEWTSSNPVAVRIGDWLVPSDTFQLWDFNAPVGAPVSNGTQWTSIAGCAGDPVKNAACHWTNVPDVAWTDAAFARDTILFSPGAHSLAIQVLTIPVKPNDPDRIFYEDGTFIISAMEVLSPDPSASSVPEPASMLLLGSGLAGVMLRSRRQRRLQSAIPVKA